MRRMALVVIALLAIALVPAGTSAAPRSGGGRLGPDIRELDPQAKHVLTLSPQEKKAIRTSAAAMPRQLAPPVVGEERFWLATDTTQGDYVKEYTLRGIGTNIEVWVSSDEDKISSGLDFPAGDCRNDGCATYHRRPGQLPDRPVRHQHVPDRVELVQRRASAGRQQRVPREAHGPPQGLLQGARGPHRHAHRQRPRRELLRQEQRDITAVHRGVLHILLRRPHQPVVMSIDAFDWSTGRGRTRPTSRPRIRASTRRLARSCTRGRSRTSTSTCSRTTSTPTR